jgi:hypothetical protein
VSFSACPAYPRLACLCRVKSPSFVSRVAVWRVVSREVEKAIEDESRPGHPKRLCIDDLLFV